MQDHPCVGDCIEPLNIEIVLPRIRPNDEYTSGQAANHFADPDRIDSGNPHHLHDQPANGQMPDHNSPVLGRLHRLETRLARSHGEIFAAQALRYQVFYEEMSAIEDAGTLGSKLDRDRFDRLCDHLLVLDNGAGQSPEIVATYRLLRQQIAKRQDGFYAAGEFDIGPILSKFSHQNFLELGRSCVKPGYRDRRTIELAWHGIWTYVKRHNVDVMIGCASLEGTDPQKLAVQLSFLHHHARAPEPWQVRALEGRGQPMAMIDRHKIDTKAALRALPPLLKGYLRVGAWVGEDAVVDSQFGTTDVFIILPVANINKRYIRHYGVNAERFAS